MHYNWCIHHTFLEETKHDYWQVVTFQLDEQTQPDALMLSRKPGMGNTTELGSWFHSQ